MIAGRGPRRQRVITGNASMAVYAACSFAQRSEADAESPWATHQRSIAAQIFDVSFHRTPRNGTTSTILRSSTAHLSSASRISGK